MLTQAIAILEMDLGSHISRIAQSIGTRIGYQIGQNEVYRVWSPLHIFAPHHLFRPICLFQLD